MNTQKNSALRGPSAPREEGVPHQGVGNKLDGESRGLAEQAAREKRLAEQARLLDLSFDAIIVRDREDRVIYWNRGAEQLYGYRSEEAKGSPTHKLLKTRFPEPLEHIRDQLEREGRWEGELIHTRKDGTRITTLSRWAVDRDAEGRMARVLETNSDMTRQRRAEERLRDLHQRLEYHVRNTPLAVIDFDSELRVSAWNDGAQRVFGWAASEVEGRSMWEIPWICEEDRGKIEKVSAGLVSGQTPRSVSPNRNVRKDGKVIWCEWHNSSLTDAEGKLQSIQALVLDVTERKEAEEALRLSESELKQAQRLAHIGSWYWDAKSDVTTGSDELLRIYGFDPGKEDMPTFREQRGRCYPAGDWEQVNAAVQNALETGIGYELDVRAIRNGSTIWITTRGEVVRDGSGRIVGLRGTVQDITARKRAEDALQDSERLYRAIGESIDYGIWICDPQGRNTYASESFLKMVGITQKECSEFGWGSVLHPEDAEDTIAAWRRCVQTGGPWYREHRFRGANGQWHPVLACGVPVRDERGQVTCWAGINLDISRLKQAEDALRESEKQFRTLADSMPNLAWWANGDGYLTWCNRRWFEYTGTTPEAMEGWGWQTVHDPELLPRVLERWSASIATGEPFEMEFPLRSADGRFRWFLTRVMPVRDASGKVVRWFGTNTDVSDLREAREVLARSKAELELLVAERTAKLQELVGELEHFSYTITHDMRAPLRAMRGFAEVVNELCAECPQERQKEFLGRIIIAAERMDALITDALNYSKAVRQELPLAPVDVARLVRGMLDSYPEFQSAHAEIAVERGMPLVMGNEAGLTQCFSNLLGNAVKFVEPGKRARVRVWGELRDAWVRLWVEDNGIGISPSMLPRVFEMFSRGHSAHAGTGIGLALVRKVVDRMGGRVGVESEPGKGSRFWVELRSGDVRREPARAIKAAGPH